MNGQTEAAGLVARGLGSRGAPHSLPSPPCPPSPRRDVRFCQVAHAHEARELVTTYCLCAIAMQGPPGAPRAGGEQSVLTSWFPRLPASHSSGDVGSDSMHPDTSRMLAPESVWLGPRVLSHTWGRGN